MEEADVEEEEEEEECGGVEVVLMLLLTLFLWGVEGGRSLFTPPTPPTPPTNTPYSDPQAMPVKKRERGV